ncbi:hypothetical protein ASD29_07395 [Streptomyces sp. Root1295]|nr:hypothetical protein ASD29_07395 [Streptomyces sp. Root1295]
MWARRRVREAVSRSQSVATARGVTVWSRRLTVVDQPAPVFGSPRRALAGEPWFTSTRWYISPVTAASRSTPPDSLGDSGGPPRQERTADHPRAPATRMFARTVKWIRVGGA